LRFGSEYTLVENLSSGFNLFFIWLFLAFIGTVFFTYAIKLSQNIVPDSLAGNSKNEITVSNHKKLMAFYGTLIEGMDIERKGVNVVMAAFLMQLCKRTIIALVIVFLDEQPVFALIILS
jgi:small-conductance mechanosensitive channel